MDEARRAELKARRAAILEAAAARDRAARRAEFVQMVPILKELEAAGDDYDSFGYRGLPTRLNFWAHDPRRYAMREETHAPLPADPEQRNAMILSRLGDRLGGDALVTVVLRREGLALELRMPVLIRHLDTLFDNARSDQLAFAAPPADWIVATWHVDQLGISEIVTGTLVDRDTDWA